MEEIKKFIETTGYSFTPEVSNVGPNKGYWENESGKGWYVTHKYKNALRFTFGVWKTGEKFSQTFGEGLIEDDPEYLQKLKEIEIERVKGWHEAQFEAKALLTVATFELPTYLVKKGFTERPSVALSQMSPMGGYDLLLPMLDEFGEVWNLQRIEPSGFKKMLPKGRSEGLFLKLSGVNDKSILICEGFSTSLSVFEALKKEVTVVCAFSAGNLETVSKIIRRLHPQAKIVVAADNDHANKINTGIVEGERAALASGGSIIYPIFPEGKLGSDWNDYHRLLGLEECGREILKQIEHGSVGGEVLREQALITVRDMHAPYLKPYINGLKPLPEKRNSKGRVIAPLELEVANHVLSYYGGRLLAQDDDLFLYDGTHWKLLDIAGISTLKTHIIVAFSGNCTNGKVESTLKMIKGLVKYTERNIFDPNPYCVNFKNGTLHVVLKDNVYSLEFKPHDKSDHLLSLIPIEYDVSRTSRNDMFLKMLDTIFEGDPEKEDKLILLQEMYGACLAPIFPQMFMLYGPGGTGKTSLMIPAMRLVHKSNWCSVEPNQMEGFNLENMLGKLVNFVTDIQVHEPINDAVCKSFYDRVPFTVNRKFKRAISAPLPAIHVFAGNEVPPTLDRGSDAFFRRWSFIKCYTLKYAKTPTFNYANDAFDSCPEGVVAWAIGGLERLLAKKDYHRFASDREALEEWQVEHDSVALFLEDLKEGEIPGLLVGGEVDFVLRGVMWEKYVNWHEESYSRKPRIGKKKFYKALGGKKLFPHKSKTGMVYRGIRIDAGLQRDAGF